MHKTELKPTVALTSATVEKMSRHEMLEWVNSTVHGQHKKIEELCSGVAYCQMMELLFPNCIGLKRIKTTAKLEHEFLYNLKLFQAAFIKLNFDKSVPIDRLMKAKFQDNFEFLQWFKKFFDTHSAGKENLRVPAAHAAAAQNAPKPIRKPGAQTLGTAKPSATKQELLKTPKGTQPHEERQVSPSSIQTLQQTQVQLAEQILTTEHERDTYYKKLAEIEAILNASLQNNVHMDWCNRALTILYATDDGPATSPADELAHEHIEGISLETDV
ncbi:microtubule-associated protein RP/EB family member 1 isoform X2 [Stomoxys calcitrans]|nr:microtubule-associated protein RP/EB family member 1 isoform X2 [Stomoxys calcitrans]XP_013104841.1 microtubule-associated protein RP/EB family member 1 isoform X2 [Stomoxys calcitrans]XP_013104842.1 microtubule-associated protein RP/EB family member 1 isoform X2 [Stomoxys calcitrans]XP_013104843.1 microtubule-associated protein RP/EB family member 1 isoform X2 [Stomoxys calcitrans]XP_013104844.1 microtubule-associated protein RP/EB family member 1 isoform X2 [Stomoxys calcitrans]